MCTGGRGTSVQESSGCFLKMSICLLKTKMSANLNEKFHFDEYILNFQCMKKYCIPRFLFFTLPYISYEEIKTGGLLKFHKKYFLQEHCTN